MRHHTLTAIATGSWLLAAAAPALPVTLEECQRWMAQLRTEAAQATITGEESKDDRRTLLESVDGARRKGRDGKASESIDDVKEFSKRAASLAADGKVSRVEGDRLKNLSETVQRCLEQAGQAGRSD